MSSPSVDPAPFQLTCTPAVPELLSRLGCTIALSTYQAGKLVFVSAQNEERLVQLPRTFPRPMALQVNGDTLALSTLASVEFFRNDARMAASYPPQPSTYDALFLPRRTLQTGQLDTHGIEWGRDGSVWIVNTRFACLARLSEEHSFEPAWSPPFVSAIAPEDRCHLNGVAFRDGQPAYATCLSMTDEPEGWRKVLPNNGVLLNVSTNEVVARDLPMPHSPRFVDDRLYILLSATGELARVDTASGTVEVVEKIGGFVRGMAYYRSHLFIAHSKLRKNSSTFRDLPIADEATEAGIAILHEPSGTIVGRLAYRQSVDEIFDVAILPGLARPGIVGLDREERNLAITTPQSSYWVMRRPRDEDHSGATPQTPRGDAQSD